MTQYKITFFRNKQNLPVANYFREFETIKELKEWCRDMLISDTLYSRYTYGTVSLEKYLKELEEITRTQK